MSSQVEGTVTAAAPRRSLFPKAYTNKKAQQQPKKEKHVSFSPYARCLKLEPLNLTEEEKAELWWQKDDYEDFSRIGKIISKAMLEGGSEVWLRSKCSSSLSSPSPSPSPSPSSSPTPIDSEVIPKSITSPTNNCYTSKDDTMIPNNSSSTTTTTTITTITNAGVRISSPLHLHNENEQENEHNEFSLLLLLTMTTTEESEQHESQQQQQQQELLGSSEEIQTKWWHRFGHSRRGLEHITASGAEGRQRYSTARSAIRCVLDEQKRQRLFPPKKTTTTTTTTTKGYNNNKCCCLDADKFRSVYHPKTQWARLLARAAGDSDADAVRTNFDETKRKSREHYLRRHLLAGSGSGSKTSDGSSSSSDAVVVVVAPTTTAEMPGFMTAVLSPETRPKIRKKLDLDANTLSQLCFRNSRNFNSNSRSRPPPDKRRPKADEKKHKNKNKHKNKSSVDYPVHEKKLDDDDNNNNNNDDDDNDDNNNNDDDEEASTSSETSSSTEDTSTSNLAKMAAGWGGEESTSKEDMSSVLIGMGIATTKPNITIG